MLREYKISLFPKDLIAGVTLGLVMIPVGLAFGELAVGVVSFGTIRGIGIGVLFSLVLVLRALAFPTDAILDKIKDDDFTMKRSFPMLKLFQELLFIDLRAH